MAALANVALTNTFDTWRLRTNALLARVNQFAIDETSLYATTLTANSSFRVKGTSVLQGGVTMHRSLIVNNNITVSGNTTLGGASKTLTIGGSGATVNATGWFGVTGRASVSTNLDVAGNTKFGAVGKTANVVGFLSVSGHQYIFHNLQVAGNTRLGGIGKTLTIGDTGSTTNATGWFGVTGRATVSTNLFVGGNTTLNGTTTDRSNALSQTLTDGATINWNTSLGRVATVTLGGARAMAAATNQKVGTYILRVVQDGTGGRTLTWNGNYKWTAQTAPVLSTAIGAVDIITFFSDGSKMYGSYLPDVR
jgi:hypothetical protein